MHDLKKKILFAAIDQTGYQNRKKKNQMKNPLESIGASFSKMSLLEPEIFTVKEWFQVNVPTPCSFRSSLIGVYGFWHMMI